MYYCHNCKNEFEEPEVEKESFENFYGVSHLFPTQNYFDHKLCPGCGDDDIEEMNICDMCGEPCLYDDLIDSEGRAGGGIGFICPDCARDCDLIS